MSNALHGRDHWVCQNESSVQNPAKWTTRYRPFAFLDTLQKAKCLHTNLPQHDASGFSPFAKCCRAGGTKCSICLQHCNLHQLSADSLMLRLLSVTAAASEVEASGTCDIAANMLHAKMSGSKVTVVCLWVCNYQSFHDTSFCYR